MTLSNREKSIAIGIAQAAFDAGWKWKEYTVDSIDSPDDEDAI